MSLLYHRREKKRPSIFNQKREAKETLKDTWANTIYLLKRANIP